MRKSIIVRLYNYLHWKKRSELFKCHIYILKLNEIVKLLLKLLKEIITMHVNMSVFTKKKTNVTITMPCANSKSEFNTYPTKSKKKKKKVYTYKHHI